MRKQLAALLMGVTTSPLGCDALQSGTASVEPSASSSPKTSAPATSAPREVDASASKKEFVTKLRAALGSAEKAEREQKPCSEATGTLHAYGLEFAKHTAQGQPLSKSHAEMTAFRPPHHQLLAKDAGSMTPEDAERLAEIFRVEHVAFIEATKLVLPAVEDDKSFASGELEGWVHVVSLADATLECSVPIAFTSSEKVEWTESLSPEQAAQRFDVAKSDASFHVRVDFFVQGHAALKAALATIGPKLALRLR